MILLNMDINQDTIQHTYPLTVAIILSIAIFVYIFKRYVDGPEFKVDSYDLKGKTAVITGGNGGIGY